MSRTYNYIHYVNSLVVPVPEKYSYVREEYSDLLHDPPRIADPVNPSANLYNNGLRGDQPKGEKWALFVAKVDTLDLSPAIMKEHEEAFKTK